MRWTGRDMFRDVLIGPFRAYVFLSSGGVLLPVPVGRAHVSFCCRLVGRCAFRFSFVVVAHLCCWSVFLVYRVYVAGGGLSVVRLRSILGVRYVGGVSWL